MKPRKPIVSVLPAVLLLMAAAPRAAAQEDRPATVEGRLLEILRERGVIDEGEFEELRRLEAGMRTEAAVEEALERRLDAMVARIADEPPTTGYRPGRGFHWTTADGRFRLTLGGRLQVRLTYDAWQENAGAGNEDEADFDVPRARVWLRGHAFRPWWKYKFQFDIAGDDAAGADSGGMSFSSDNELTELKDAYLEFARHAALMVRAGQFKVPYSRQQLTSSGTQQFVDRAVTDKVFAPGRSTGVMIFGGLGGEDHDLFEYYAGVFDGEGENETNDDEGLMWAGRVALNPLGPVSYTESDLQDHEEIRLALGVNAWLHQDDNHAGMDDDWSVGADAAAFWRGFFALLELHLRRNGVESGPDEEALGWLAQLGYMVIPGTLEVGLRAAEVDWDDATGETARRETLLVLGWFVENHKLKIQVDFGRVDLHFLDPVDNREDWRLRVQIQIIF